MEILNILYNNSNIAFYLIGAILVVIIIFIIISSMYTTPKIEKKEEILEDPTEKEKVVPNIIETKEEIKEIERKTEEKEVVQDIPKINDIVENLYQKSLTEEIEQKDETSDLNSFLQEFEVPNNVIKEVVNSDKEEIITEATTVSEKQSDIEIPLLKEETIIDKEQNTIPENKENIENMLKRLYDLRQTENDARKNALLNEIYDLKKQVDETLKSAEYNCTLNYSEVDTKALADYYLFNEDIEFPKLK